MYGDGIINISIKSTDREIFRLELPIIMKARYTLANKVWVSIPGNDVRMDIVF